MADRSIKVRLEAEVSQYKKDLEGAAKATEKLAASAELAAQNVTVAAAKQKEAATRVASAEKALKQAQDSGKASASDLAAAERKVSEAKRGHWQASQELKSAQEGLTRANLAQAESALKQQSALKRASVFWEENRADIDSVGNSLAVTGAAGVAALGGMTKMAMSWESAWAGVTKTVDGTDAQMAALQADLRGMAKELPATHEEIAAVAEAAGQLGIQTKNVKSFTRTMIDLGETTNMSADVAATQIARFTNVMGTSQTEVGRLGSTIVGLGNNFATTESEIMDMAMRLAGAGKQAKMSESDVLGIAAAMSSVGIEAEAGGSAMSMTMKRIQKEVETGGEQLGFFAQVAGMTAQEFAQAWGQDSAGALTKFVMGLGTAEQRGMSANAVLAELGITGIRESDSLLRLSSANDLMAASLGLSADAYRENNALADEAAKRYETTESKVKMAANSLKDAGIEVGQYVLPVLADLADGAADLAGWFAALPEPVKGVITAVGGFASVTALAVGGGLRMVGVMSDSITSARRLSTEMPRVGRAIKGVGTAAAVAAPLLTALMIAASYDGGDSTQGLEEMEANIKKLGEGAHATDTIFKNTLGAGQDIDFERFLDKITNPDTGTKIQGFWESLHAGTGKFLGADWRSDMQKSTDDFKAFDAAMASMAGQDFSSVSNAFQTLMLHTDGTDESAQRLLKSMPGLRDALIGVASDAGLATDDATLLDIAMGRVAVATDDAASAAADAKPTFEDITQSMQDQADAIDDAWKALMDYADGVLGLRGAERSFEESIDAASEAVKKNGKTLDINTEKGRANQAALDDIAKSGLAVVDAAREQGASQEELEKKMGRTRESFIKSATAMGMTKDAAKKLADEMGLIPTNVQAKVTVNTAAAVGVLTGVKKQLLDMDGRVFKTTLQVSTNGAFQLRSIGENYRVAARASGGSVFGPGTETSDSIPALLSNNEHVWSAAEVRGAGGHGAMERMRAMAKTGLLPAFSNGGAVGEADVAGAKITSILAKAKGLAGYRSGGYTGDGVASQIAGPVHKREFVAHEKATKAYRPWLESMNAGTFTPQVAVSSPQVYVNVDKRLFEGMAMTLLVDGKPMKGIIQSEVKDLVSTAARGY